MPSSTRKSRFHPPLLLLLGLCFAVRPLAAASSEHGAETSAPQSSSASPAKTSQPAANGSANLELQMLRDEPQQRKLLLQRARELEQQQQIQRQRQRDQQMQAEKHAVERALQRPDVQSVQPHSEHNQ